MHCSLGHQRVYRSHTEPPLLGFWPVRLDIVLNGYLQNSPFFETYHRHLTFSGLPGLRRHAVRGSTLTPTLWGIGLSGTILIGTDMCEIRSSVEHILVN